MNCPTTSGSNHSLTTNNGSSSSSAFCRSWSDTVSCWPITPAASFAVVPCPAYHDGFSLAPGNATRYCAANGTWSEKSNYSQCLPMLDTNEQDDLYHKRVNMIIYYVGFSVSIIALSIALFLFLYFRSLRCLRNTIHCHLIVTFLLRHLFWLKMVPAVPFLEATNHAHKVICKILFTLLQYFLVTNYFWMLVEGLYLHVVLFWSFSHDRLRFWHYAMLGWGVPAIFICAWAIVKAKYDQHFCWLDHDNYYDYIFIAPIFLALAINVFFLLTIVWILVTKLRATNSSQNILYRKASKATLILFPLLGVTYMLLLYLPDDSDLVYVTYISAILQSTQGLFVGLIYCFMNVEVQLAVRKFFSRWRDSRTLSLRTQTSIVGQTEQSSLQSSIKDGLQTKLKDLNRDCSKPEITSDSEYVNGFSSEPLENFPPKSKHPTTHGVFDAVQRDGAGTLHDDDDDDENGQESEQDFTNEDLV